MGELTKEQKEQGFYTVSPIFYKDKEFIKRGNINDNNVYFFEIIDGKAVEIEDNDILNALAERFCYKSDDVIY